LHFIIFVITCILIYISFKSREFVLSVKLWNGARIVASTIVILALLSVIPALTRPPPPCIDIVLFVRLLLLYNSKYLQSLKCNLIYFCYFIGTLCFQFMTARRFLLCLAFNVTKRLLEFRPFFGCDFFLVKDYNVDKNEVLRSCFNNAMVTKFAHYN